MAVSYTHLDVYKRQVRLYEAIGGNTAVPAPANTFTDTQNPEILKAFQLGIVNGVGQGKFAPGNPISRQEIATMLLRTVKAAVPQLNTDTANAPSFVDSADIADWARELSLIHISRKSSWAA